MRKLRKYVCKYDTGHAYGDFEFYSEYRKGSTNNRIDCLAEMWKRFKKYYKIIDIYLIESY